MVFLIFHHTYTIRFAVWSMDFYAQNLTTDTPVTGSSCDLGVFFIQRSKIPSLGFDEQSRFQIINFDREITHDLGACRMLPPHFHKETATSFFWGVVVLAVVDSNPLFWSFGDLALRMPLTSPNCKARAARSARTAGLLTNGHSGQVKA